jgi:hypothetical protein
MMNFPSWPCDYPTPVVQPKNKIYFNSSNNSHTQPLSEYIEEKLQQIKKAIPELDFQKAIYDTLKSGPLFESSVIEKDDSKIPHYIHTQMILDADIKLDNPFLFLSDLIDGKTEDVTSKDPLATEITGSITVSNESVKPFSEALCAESPLQILQQLGLDPVDVHLVNYLSFSHSGLMTTITMTKSLPF